MQIVDRRTSSQLHSTAAHRTTSSVAPGVQNLIGGSRSTWRSDRVPTAIELDAALRKGAVTCPTPQPWSSPPSGDQTRRVDGVRAPRRGANPAREVADALPEPGDR